MRCAILGSGNIGTDLMMKLLKGTDASGSGQTPLELVALVGIDPASDGLARAKALGIEGPHEGPQWIDPAISRLFRSRLGCGCGGRRGCSEFLAAGVLLTERLTDRLTAPQHLLHGPSVGGLVSATEEARHGVGSPGECAGPR